MTKTTLIKEIIWLRVCLFFRGLVHSYLVRKENDRHGGGAVTKNFTSWSAGIRKWQTEYYFCELIPNDTHSPRQDHTYFNMTILSIPSGCRTYNLGTKNLNIWNYGGPNSFWVTTVHQNIRKITKTIPWCLSHRSL